MEESPFRESPEPVPAAPVPPPPPLDVLGCFERSFALLRAHPMPLIPAALIAALLSLSGLLHPVAGYVYQFAFVGLVSAGVTQIFLKRIRNQDTRLGDLLIGFRERPRDLVLATLFCSGLQQLASYPLSNYLLNPTSMPVWLASLSLLAALFLIFAYTFVFPLVLDRGLGPWEAMETSRRLVMHQPLRVFGLLLLCFLVIVLGFLCLVVGLILAIPLAMGALAHAYEELVRATE